MAWRVAHSLIKLRDQFNEQFPTRSKRDDGTIGDAAHASRSSDHNPWVQDAGQGVVTAMDITHDPGSGVDTWEIAEFLRTQRDPRIKYVISNRRIFNSSNWQWRKYTGSNPHSAHMHVSVQSTKGRYDSTANWTLVPPEWMPTLRKGNKGPYVRKMQQHLGMAVDGNFGANTETRVREFQLAHGLKADGVVGKATWDKLIVVPPPRVAPPSEPEVVETEPEIEQADVDSPGARPVLRKGHTKEHGDLVREVQRLLLHPPSGVFGDTTEIAVRAFQRGADLDPDGVVGAMTWEKLDDLEQLPEPEWITDIVATVFGGRRDPNKSAYENRWISDEELGVALPYRFKGERPQVVVANPITGKQIVCEIVDVGPWNTNDPYWETGSRPQAETGRDQRGRRTNLAGLDLTPGAARALGINGKAKVSWAFAKDVDMGGGEA
jgi:peptidoglycan hydrolase-like protein with peptidoglycan-binding domain